MVAHVNRIAQGDGITSLLLVRHATCALMDSILLGRTIDMPLDNHGEAQARALGEHLKSHRGLLVESSPRQRARQTASAIAKCAGTTVTITSDLDEVDFGEWSGCPFAELATDSYWRVWNEQRSSAYTPAGDNMLRIRSRVMNRFEYLHRWRRGREIVLVTHAEIIRSVVLHCRGMSDNDFTQVEITPASITTVCMSDHGLEVDSVNHQAALVTP